jgi:uncharacterized protein (TIGR02118 family)
VIKVVAMYRKPADMDAFMRHYLEVHIPLVLATPGLTRVEVTRVTRALVGEAPFVLMAEMCYPDLDVFKAAMRSKENTAVGDDLRSFAADLVTVVQGETVG